MATQLLFALPMASASLQRWPPLRDWQATLGDNRRRGVRLDDRRQAYHQLVEHAASGSITIDWQPLPLERAGQA
jgi:hypothetical protein